MFAYDRGKNNLSWQLIPDHVYQKVQNVVILRKRAYF